MEKEALNRLLKSLALTESEAATTAVPHEDVREGIEHNKRSLIGKFLWKNEVQVKGLKTSLTTPWKCDTFRFKKNQRRVVCPENEEVAVFLWDKWQEMAQKPKGISENLNNTMTKAYSGLCNCKTPIKSLKDLAEIKGVGKWILKLMQGFFNAESGNSENDEVTKNGKLEKGTRRYLPQKNSVAYALLITLYRDTLNGSEFMRKQELIDAAEASGLSRAPIAPEKGKGKPGQFGSSPRDWYSGWSCMKTLVAKSLVVKSSCPAKYMLTEEGKKVARECLARSGLDSNDNRATVNTLPVLETQRSLDTGLTYEGTLPSGSTGLSAKGVTASTIVTTNHRESIDVPPEFLDKLLSMGFSKERINRAYREASESSEKRDVSSLWPALLCCLKEYQLYDLPSEAGRRQRDVSRRGPTANVNKGDDVMITKARNAAVETVKSYDHPHLSEGSHTLRSCSSPGYTSKKDLGGALRSKSNAVAKPPLDFGEIFEDAYEVILVLDDREHFVSQGSRSKKIIENVGTQFRIQIEVRRLPVGDAIWLARHKYIGTEYVLDFVVERKKVDDLRQSIRDNRYKDQKLRLLRCGLKKMIYLVEGDPNSSEASESIKTACFTTEILEGFDVQRTSGLAYTLKKYGYLTHAINQYYKSLDYEDKSSGVCCSPYDEFIRRCDDLEKMTVSDVFAIQLMQVPQVTEEIAVAVLDMYPTLASLALAYSELDGNIDAQEEMLKRQSNNRINGAASRNIFQLIWGS